MFLFKKIAGALLLPVSLSVIMMLAGWFLLYSRKRQRVARVLILTGMIILLIPALGFFSDLLLRPLESRYQPLDTLETPVSYVVVLGGGITLDGDSAGKARPSRASLARLAEAVRLYKLAPGSNMILCGGSIFGQAKECEALAESARILGVRPKDIIMECQSLDTGDQSRLVKPLVGGRPFVLVTSAAHMPRAMALFRKQQMEPVPAPADFLPRDRDDPRRFIPRVSALVKSETALYEYLGMAWAWLRGEI